MLLRFFLLLVLLPLPVAAEKTVDLFTAKALVINQSQEVRRQAASNGLATVLVRVSGNRQLLQQPDIKQAIRSASNYLHEFSYQSTDKTITIAGAAKPATQLVMRFSQPPLENLLKNAQLPIWSANRPDLLVWTAIDSGGKNYVGQSSTMGRALKSVAADRGLPLVMPVLDLEDRSALSVSRLWAIDEGSVRVAARRYQADATLAGRFSKDRKGWTGSFILLHQGKTQYFTATGGRQTVIAQSIMDQVADYFATIYAVVPRVVDGAQALLLQVNNIGDFGRYTQVLSYLEQLTLVQSLVLTNINQEQMQVKVNLNTDRDRFLTTLRLDKRLQRVENPGETTGNLPEVQVSLGQPDLPVVEGTDTNLKPLEFVWR